MKSLSLSTRMIAASVVLAALVAGVFAVLIYAVVTLDNRARAGGGHEGRPDSVGRAREARHRSRVRTARRRADGQSPLSPAGEAGRQVDRRAGELERLVADNPTQLQRVRNLRLAINGYVGDYLEPMVNLAQENIAAVRQNAGQRSEAPH